MDSRSSDISFPLGISKPTQCWDLSHELAASRRSVSYLHGNDLSNDLSVPRDLYGVPRLDFLDRAGWILAQLTYADTVHS